MRKLLPSILSYETILKDIPPAFLGYSKVIKPHAKRPGHLWVDYQQSLIHD